MSKDKFICTLCPLGCNLAVTEEDNEKKLLKVRGQKCKKGKDFAYDEFYNPTRTITTTVAISCASLTRLPVKSSLPVPRELIFEALAKIYELELSGPIKMGDVVLEDILGTGTDIVATRSLVGKD